MSKYVIDENTLTGIGDAVRAKSGTSDKILVSELATAITNIPTGGGGGDIEVEPIVLSGAQQYGCAGAMAGTYIKLFGDTVSTSNITNANNLFYQNTAENIPFDINLASSCDNINMIFGQCNNLKELPKINGVDKSIPTGSYSNQLSIQSIFQHCYSLKVIPDDIFWQFVPNKEWWDGAKNYHKSVSMNGIFNECYSLKKLPDLSMFSGWQHTAYYSSLYYGLASGCYSLYEIINLPIMGVYTSNAFNSATNYIGRMKNFTFETNEDGTPKIAQWKSQIIDLSNQYNMSFVNGSSHIGYFLKYNPGIEAKEVKDDATYQALKDDPDWWTKNTSYSRYNHDSAVRTINSLPDCSATGTNTIKFMGNAGALTDGGAINTLTEAEIAVASAKGWTVSFV